MAIDYDAARQQLDASYGAVPASDMGTGELATLKNALNQKGGDADVGAAISGDSAVQGLIKGNMAATQKEAESYKKETDPIIEHEKDLISKPTPELPKQQDVLSYQDLQKSMAEGKQAAQSWATGIAIVGALLGGVAKKHTLVGATALAGAMEGLKEGSDAKMKQQMEDFKNANDAIKEHNDMLNKKYSDVLANRKLSLDETRGLLSDIALQHGDMVASQAAQRGDIAAFVNLQKERDKAVEKQGIYGDQVIQSAEKIGIAQNLTGQPLLDLIQQAKPGDLQVEGELNTIKMMASGELPLPVTRSGQTYSDKGEQQLLLLKKYDPSASVEKYMARVKEIAALNGPQIQNTKTFIRTAKEHIEDAKQNLKLLGNDNFIPWNKLKTMTAKDFASMGQYSVALKEYQVDIIFMADEITKALAGTGGGTLEDREAMQNVVDAANAYEPTLGALDEMNKLVTQKATIIQQLQKEALDGTGLVNWSQPPQPTAGTAAPSASPASSAPAYPAASTPTKVLNYDPAKGFY